MAFTEIFAGPEPKFEVTERKRTGPNKKAQGTLDAWVTGKKSGKDKPEKEKGKPGPKGPRPKKQTPAEIGMFIEMNRFTLNNMFLGKLYLTRNVHK